MALIIFSIVVFLIIVTGLLFDSKRFKSYVKDHWENILLNSKHFKSYVKDHWESILVNLIIVLLGAGITIFGVVWGFRKESDRNFEDQLSSFSGSYIAVMAETTNTIRSAKKLKKEISKNHLSSERFNLDNSTSVYLNPLFYKFSGSEYLFALDMYLERARYSNQLLQFVYDDFIEDGIIKYDNIEKLNNKLDSLLYYSQILQYQSQYYIYMYGPKKVIVPPNQKKVMEWIKHRNIHKIEEIEKEVEFLHENKEGISKGTMEIWKELREMNELK